MKLQTSLVLILLLSFCSCDSEQVQKLKDKVKQTTGSATSEAVNETTEKNLFNQDEAIKYISSQMPVIVSPGKFEFTSEELENEKYGKYLQIQYLTEVSYNDDYYNVDKSVSFTQILKEKNWTNEFAQLKKSPYTFYKKVAVKDETTAIQGSLIYRKSGEKMVFKDHKLERGHIIQGKLKEKFTKSYLLVGSQEADIAIDTFMQNFLIAKKQKTNVLAAVKPNKVFKGTLTLTPELKKNITLTMGKQHELLKSSEALITFDENPNLKIVLKGTYLTEIRPANRSNLNYKVDSVELYSSPTDPFFQKIRPYIQREYFTIFLAASGNLSGMSKNLKIDIRPFNNVIKK
ncbi:hypothetical protein PQO03_06545 [Lentisphaera profundi]|uniref:Lipoprotein n=1 Tax=Lentisphaera profundi TaxID=1658616 RepID=A0ABY7VNW1_9BACT|nr:hypothetical protein [Lentisphaera profundi]WDE95374.1 hypothetical protein PQO03_06545 [Lentisphaera profundi]